jgi:23S rRNA (cytidine1920-2'-O)/16S rRNA (cytidine1409-2'-O)-methyltransferase
MSLRNDLRVRLMERTNARLLEPGLLLAQASALAQSIAPPLAVDIAPSFFAMDVSFISATLVVPAVVRSLALADQQWCGEAVTLVKPQFEAGREWVGKGGIVRDPAAYDIAIDRVRSAVAEAGGMTVDVADSPITGAEGNREFLLYARFGG